MIDAFDVAYSRATSRIVCRVDAADRRHPLRRERLDVLRERFVTGGAIANERLVDEALLDDHVQHRVEQRHIGVGIELQVVGGVPGQITAARVGQDQLRPRLGGVLHPRRGDRMIHGGIGADHEDHFRMRHVADLVRDRAGVDAFHQRGHARRMAQARAVIDVVRSEAGAHQLLEQIRLFVRAFGGAETGERPLAVGIAGLAQALGRDVERFFPGGLAEDLLPVLGIDDEVLVLRRRPACGSAAW